MPLLHLHPFQNFELEKLPNWKQFDFNDDDAEFYEAVANNLELCFQSALKDSGILKFLNAYIEGSREILVRSQWNSFYYAVLEDACARLVFYYFFFKKRKRPSLATNGSAL